MLVEWLSQDHLACVQVGVEAMITCQRHADSLTKHADAMEQQYDRLSMLKATANIRMTPKHLDSHTIYLIMYSVAPHLLANATDMKSRLGDEIQIALDTASVLTRGCERLIESVTWSALCMPCLASAVLDPRACQAVSLESKVGPALADAKKHPKPVEKARAPRASSAGAKPKPKAKGKAKAKGRARARA